MKKIGLICICIALFSNAIACDVCGVTSSSNTLGIIPIQLKHIIGLKYQANHFATISSNNTETAKNYFKTIQLWTKINFHKRIHFYAFLPFKMNKSIENEKEIKVNLLGDMVLQVNYILLNTMQRKKTITQNLQLGFAVKLPTGKYNLVENGMMLHPYLQAGTGSLDYFANLQYTNRYKNWGSNTEIQWANNGVNPQSYHIGNRINTSFRMFRWIRKNNFQFIPHVGILSEFTKQDQQNKKAQMHTGGNALFTSIGADIYFKKVGVLFYIQPPIFQNLGDGHIQSSARINSQIIYLFLKKN